MAFELPSFGFGIYYFIHCLYVYKYAKNYKPN